jgi:hypothetical protein
MNYIVRRVKIIRIRAEMHFLREAEGELRRETFGQRIYTYLCI